MDALRGGWKAFFISVEGSSSKAEMVSFWRQRSSFLLSSCHERDLLQLTAPQRRIWWTRDEVVVYWEFYCCCWNKGNLVYVYAPSRSPNTPLLQSFFELSFSSPLWKPNSSFPITLVRENYWPSCYHLILLITLESIVERERCIEIPHPNFYYRITDLIMRQNLFAQVR